MAFDGEPCILRAHPFAIVLHSDQTLAAKINEDVNPTCSGIDRVFDQLFDDGGGPLDDLAGRYLVGKIGGKEGNATHDRLSTLGAGLQDRHPSQSPKSSAESHP